MMTGREVTGQVPPLRSVLRDFIPRRFERGVIPEEVPDVHSKLFDQGAACAGHATPIGGTRVSDVGSKEQGVGKSGWGPGNMA